MKDMSDLRAAKVKQKQVERALPATVRAAVLASPRMSRRDVAAELAGHIGCGSVSLNGVLGKGKTWYALLWTDRKQVQRSKTV